MHALRMTWLVATSCLSFAVWAAVQAEPRAPERLSDTGLYVSGRPGEVDPRNRPFSPQYPLWSDGATKTRWIYLPPGTAIDVRNADAWSFPVGTRFWKEFAFNGRKVETRLLWKASPTRWEFATYVWNEAQTDATLAPDRGVLSGATVAAGKRHMIPAVTDCVACHGTNRDAPLGFNALQLSPDRDPNAIHAEPLAPNMVTLASLLDDELVTPARDEWTTAPPRITAAHPQTRAVLGYLFANCGSCHNGNGEIAALGPVLRQRDLLADGEGVARGLLGQRTRWQVPGVPEDESVLVDPAVADRSAILVRMRSRRPSSQMPPLGTVVRDQAAVDAIANWVALTASH